MEYYEGIPVEFTRDEDYAIVQPASPVIDDGIDFWEGIISAEIDNHVKDEEKFDEMDLNILMSQNVSQPQPIANTYVDDANSSTNSTRLLILMKRTMSFVIPKLFLKIFRIRNQCMQIPLSRKVRVIVISIYLKLNNKSLYS